MQQTVGTFHVPNSGQPKNPKQHSRKQNGRPVELMEEVLKTVTALGYEQTIDLLKNGRQPQPAEALTAHSPCVSFVFGMVCDHFAPLTASQILSPDEHSDKIKHAAAFCIYYLRRLDVPISELKTIFNKRNKTTFWRSCKLIQDLNPKLKADRTYCDQKALMDVRFADYRLTAIA